MLGLTLLRRRVSAAEVFTPVAMSRALGFVIRAGIHARNKVQVCRQSILPAFSTHAGGVDRDLNGIFKQYPSKFDASHTVAGVIQQFASIEDGARCTDTVVTLCGRITAKRDASNKLCFYDVTSDGATIQVSFLA